MKYLLLLLLISCEPRYKCIDGISYRNIGGDTKESSHYVKVALFKKCLPKEKVGLQK